MPNLIVRVLDRIVGWFIGRKIRRMMDKYIDPGKQVSPSEKVLLNKLCAFPLPLERVQESKEFLEEYSSTITTANKSKESLRKKGVEVGDDIPLPHIPSNDLISNIDAVRKLYDSLQKAINYFKWENSYMTEVTDKLLSNYRELGKYEAKMLIDIAYREVKREFEERKISVQKS